MSISSTPNAYDVSEASIAFSTVRFEEKLVCSIIIGLKSDGTISPTCLFGTALFSPPPFCMMTSDGEGFKSFMRL